jgi:iron complex outermembrane recepter protein
MACALLIMGHRGLVYASEIGIDLAALSLEELMGIEVTLPSRGGGTLFETAAAVYVLTGDDLRRSGVTSIPEALRLVPGMQVGHIGASKWAISARGFNDRFAQKLLVLIDGRNIYSPLFGGVFWEEHDLILADVERIEIIRGPGATLWGANAVNGIVNIVTRGTEQTQGGLVQLGAGSEERALAALRYGGSWGQNAQYRVYGKFFDRDAFVDSSGARAADQWQVRQFGLRAEWKPNSRDELSGQGGLRDSQAGQTWRFPTLEAPYLEAFNSTSDGSGAYAVLRWKRTLSASSDLRLQTYYTHRRIVDMFNGEKRNSYDVDFQHRSAHGRHQVVWGLGYRFTSDNTRSSLKVSFDPARRSDHLFSAFAQDAVDLLRDRLRLTIGSKFEHNAYTGFEFQPNARLLWTPHSQHVLWAAFSRALRTPARADDDVRIALRTFPTETIIPFAGPDSPPLLAYIAGNRAFRSEKLLACEAGYRVRPHENLFVDVATFYNDYDNLRSGVLSAPIFVELPAPHFTADLLIANAMRGRALGGELAVEWHLARHRLRLAYSYLNIDLDLKAGALPENKDVEKGHPEHQFYVWHSFDVRPDLQLDAIGRYVGGIFQDKESDGLAYGAYLPQRAVGGYFELDLRLAWQLNERMGIDLVGQNLLQKQHAEFVDFFIDTLPTETQRGVYAAATWKF